MAPKRKVMQWNDTVHTDILIAMSDSISFSGEQWASIMTTLETMDYDFTGGALKPTAVMPSKWDDPAVNQALLELAFTLKEWNGDDYHKMAILLTEKGHETTFQGIRQHIQKLKRKDKDAAAASSAPGTPAATPSGKGRKRNPDTPGPDAGTPSKKARGRKPAVKKEKSEEEEQEELDSKPQLEDMDDDIQEEVRNEV